jgi:NTE family protein
MVGVVLEGGGAKGSYQVGALLALKKSRIKIDGVVGTSIGAINAAFVVQNNYRILKRMWTKATSEGIIGIKDDTIKKIRNFKSAGGCGIVGNSGTAENSAAFLSACLRDQNDMALLLGG